ncbi:MAG TPA: taurine catabolism dioxygenase TauD [Gammaproteobacteria bacterium]|nr:taurine catabolism dioxygenase TauD [Gammaproteobacteria bacterium]
MSQQVYSVTAMDSPFELANDIAYKRWCDARLPHKEPVLADLCVNISDPYRLSAIEKTAILERCEMFNMAVYQLKDTGSQGKSLVHALGEQISLVNLDTNLRSDDDSVSSLEVRVQAGNQYIPYTNKALSWHTDGYYNRLDKQIYGIVMHCVRPAAGGGVNSLLNPEDVYMMLRDKDPAYIEALMHPEAMTIPDNLEKGKVIRKAQTGPVFLIKPDGRLHMRFSARKRNIQWRDTPDTKEAVDMINALMADDKNVIKVALGAGQGIICNNVLHNRSGFVDSDKQTRLLYRARYYDAVG